jgi:hypothetical protein
MEGGGGGRGGGRENIGCTFFMLICSFPHNLDIHGVDQAKDVRIFARFDMLSSCDKAMGSNFCSAVALLYWDSKHCKTM